MPDLLITDRGAVADGSTPATAAIQACIDDASAAGGGRVVVPPGRFRTGSLRLKDHVELHLSEGSELRSIGGPEAFPVLAETLNLPGVIRALVWADGATGIAITGRGVLHGDGDSELWGEIVLTPAAAFRPALVYLRGCTGVVLRDVRLHYSQYWTCHLLRCTDVLVDAIDIRTHRRRINADGIDPDGCRLVRIRDCTIDSTDDAICLKSTEGDPCEDIVVTGCLLTSRCAAIKLGTESLGPIRRVRVADCIVRGSEIGLALYLKDQGSYEDVALTGCTVDTDGPWALVVDAAARAKGQERTGRIVGVDIDGCRFRGGRAVIRALQRGALRGLRLRACAFTVGDQKAATTTPGGARRIDPDPAWPDDAARPFHVVITNAEDVDLDLRVDDPRSAADRGGVLLHGCDGVRGHIDLRSLGNQAVVATDGSTHVDL
jgi:hypothetical protein